jgi:hypothetical protein
LDEEDEEEVAGIRDEDAEARLPGSSTGLAASLAAATCKDPAADSPPTKQRRKTAAAPVREPQLSQPAAPISSKSKVKSAAATTVQTPAAPVAGRGKAGPKRKQKEKAASPSPPPASQSPLAAANPAALTPKEMSRNWFRLNLRPELPHEKWTGTTPSNLPDDMFYRNFYSDMALEEREDFLIEITSQVPP